MSEELKPCPFCGGQPKLVVEGENIPALLMSKLCYIDCPKCKMRTAQYATKDLLIQNWNLRVESECAVLAERETCAQIGRAARPETQRGRQ